MRGWPACRWSPACTPPSCRPWPRCCSAPRRGCRSGRRRSTSVLVGASLVGLAEPGSAQWVALAVWLALIAGVDPARAGRGPRRLGAEPGELAGAGRLQPGRGPADHRLADSVAAGSAGRRCPACGSRRSSTSRRWPTASRSLLLFVAGQAFRAAAADRAAGDRRRRGAQPLERLLGARRRDRRLAGGPAGASTGRGCRAGTRWARCWCRRWSSPW